MRKDELIAKARSLRLEQEELKSLTDTAYEKIKAAILKGVLPPGSRLAERQLSEEMGVSTTTVKRALGLLAMEGLLEIQPRRGTYVAQQASGNPRETMMVRAALEGLAARFAAEKANPEDIQSLEKQLKLMESRTEKGSLASLVQANTEFHYKVHRIGRNPYIMRLIDILRSFDISFRRKALSDKEEAWKGFTEHKAVFEAIRTHQEEEAEHLMREHILRSYDEVSEKTD